MVQEVAISFVHSLLPKLVDVPEHVSPGSKWSMFASSWLTSQTKRQCHVRDWKMSTILNNTQWLTQWLSGPWNKFWVQHLWNLYCTRSAQLDYQDSPSDTPTAHHCPTPHGALWSWRFWWCGKCWKNHLRGLVFPANCAVTVDRNPFNQIASTSHAQMKQQKWIKPYCVLQLPKATPSSNSWLPTCLVSIRIQSILCTQITKYGYFPQRSAMPGGNAHEGPFSPVQASTPNSTQAGTTTWVLVHPMQKIQTQNHVWKILSLLCSNLLQATKNMVLVVVDHNQTRVVSV